PPARARGLQPAGIVARLSANRPQLAGAPPDLVLVRAAAIVDVDTDAAHARVGPATAAERQFEGGRTRRCGERQHGGGEKDALQHVGHEILKALRKMRRSLVRPAFGPFYRKCRATMDIVADRAHSCMNRAYSWCQLLTKRYGWRSEEHTSEL